MGARPDFVEKGEGRERETASPVVINGIIGDTLTKRGWKQSPRILGRLSHACKAAQQRQAPISGLGNSALSCPLIVVHQGPSAACGCRCTQHWRQGVSMVCCPTHLEARLGSVDQQHTQTKRETCTAPVDTVTCDHSIHSSTFLYSQALCSGEVRPRSNAPPLPPASRNSRQRRTSPALSRALSLGGGGYVRRCTS